MLFLQKMVYYTNGWTYKARERDTTPKEATIVIFSSNNKVIRYFTFYMIGNIKPPDNFYKWSEYSG